MKITDYIADVPDFPKPGVVFKDITPLLAEPRALRETILRLIAPFIGKDVQRVVGVESRGFIFGTAVADRLGVGFVPIRKPGKLPRKTVGQSYDLEYGTDRIEIHADAVQPGERVLMVDDLLATGGTMGAAVDLVRKIGGEIVGATFVIELAFLQGRQQLIDRGVEVHSLIRITD